VTAVPFGLPRSRATWAPGLDSPAW
jgi:hypothetical protein